MGFKKRNFLFSYLYCYIRLDLYLPNLDLVFADKKFHLTQRLKTDRYFWVNLFWFKTRLQDGPDVPYFLHAPSLALCFANFCAGILPFSPDLAPLNPLPPPDHLHNLLQAFLAPYYEPPRTLQRTLYPPLLLPPVRLHTLPWQPLAPVPPWLVANRPDHLEHRGEHARRRLLNLLQPQAPAEVTALQIQIMERTEIAATI